MGNCAVCCTDDPGGESSPAHSRVISSETDRVDYNADPPVLLFQKELHNSEGAGTTSSTSADATSIDPANICGTESVPCLDSPASPQDVLVTCTNLPDETNLVDHLSALQAQWTEVQSLCREARVFEAAEALEKLIASLDSAKRHPGLSASVHSAFSKFDLQLKSDPLVRKLSKISSRMLDMLTNMPEPARENDKRWARYHVTDPTMGPKFTFDLEVRHRTDDEWIKDGPGNQVVFWVRACNMALTISQWVALNREVDIFKKEWIADCVGFDGFAFDLSQLYSSYNRMLIGSPLLAFVLDIQTIREFSVCRTSPLPYLTKKAGVLQLEYDPPTGVSEHEGMKILSPVRRSVRLQGGSKMMYIAASEKEPDCIDIVVAGSLGAPLPKWMVPVWLWKMVVGDTFTKTFKRFKQHVSDQWDKLPHNERIAALDHFYGPQKRIESESSTS